MRQKPANRHRRIALVQSPENIRRLTPGFAPFAGMGCDFWIIDLFRQPDRLLASLRDWRPDAIVTEYLAGLTEALVGLGCPVILTPSDQPVAGTFQVDVDDHAIGRLAAEHLITRGYRHFAFVGRRNAHYAGQRLAGFQAVIGDIPVHWEEFHDQRRYDEYWRDPDEDMVGWLGALPAPVGIFSAHDPTGRHVLEAAAQAGLEVPFGVGVVSANDDETVCEMARPGLSSIRLPWHRLAAEVVRMIERLEAGKAAGSPVLIQPLDVAARGSSSYEAVADPVVRKALRELTGRAAMIDSVADWAAAVGVSRRVLERRFKAALGRTPLAMIRHERVELAKKLLTTTDLPVAAIAERCGYHSNERLTVGFRGSVGVPPSAYRRGSP